MTGGWSSFLRVKEKKNYKMNQLLLGKSNINSAEKERERERNMMRRFTVRLVGRGGGDLSISTISSIIPSFPAWVDDGFSNQFHFHSVAAVGDLSGCRLGHYWCYFYFRLRLKRDNGWEGGGVRVYRCRNWSKF